MIKTTPDDRNIDNETLMCFNVFRVTIGMKGNSVVIMRDYLDNA